MIITRPCAECGANNTISLVGTVTMPEAVRCSRCRAALGTWEQLVAARRDEQTRPSARTLPYAVTQNRPRTDHAAHSAAMADMTLRVPGSLRAEDAK